MPETRRSLARAAFAASVGVLAATCVLISPASASAEGVRVLDAERKVEQVAFAADATTGRAWIDVTVARRFATGKEVRAAGTRLSVALGELVYDAAVHEIVLVDHDTRTTCATLARDVVVPTGACRVDAFIEPRAADTGFGHTVRDHLVVRVVRSR